MSGLFTAKHIKGVLLLFLRRFPAIAFLCLLLTSVHLNAQSSSEFTIVVLPDTQNYSEFRPDIFRAQTQWIADNRESQNIQLVLGVGDIVNHGSSQTEWLNADAAVDVLDGAGVPYLLAIGNHDYDNAKPSTRSAVLFNQYFGPARYANSPHYSGNYPLGSNENFYGTVEINGNQYLLLALEFYPRHGALDWAAEVLAAHADKQVIVFTHSYTNDDDSRVARCDHNTAEAFGLGADNDGDELWEKLISRHANIFLVLSGHIHFTDGTGRLAQLGVNGNLVNQILSDYQHLPQGGGGYLRIMRFRPSANQIDVTTYSPHLNAYLRDAENQFTVAIRNNGQNSGASGTVAGKVRSTSCQSLAGATVSHSGGSVTADSAGKYSLPAPADTQSISAAAAGYDTETQNALVTAGWPVFRDFFLRPAVACSPDTSGPSAKICAPNDSAVVTSPVQVLAAGYSPNSITRLELWVDGVKRHQVHGDRMETSLSAAMGSHRVTAVAVEPGGAYYKHAVNITVSDGSSPGSCSAAPNSVSICAPAEQATVASPVRILAAVHSSAGISFTQVYLDGVKKYEVPSSSVDTSLPMSPGKRRLTVQAREKSGIYLKKTIYITVS